MIIPYGEWEEILAGYSYIGVTRDYPSREWHTTEFNFEQNMNKNCDRWILLLD
jgi:hypothetical protein